MAVTILSVTANKRPVGALGSRSVAGEPWENFASHTRGRDPSAACSACEGARQQPNNSRALLHSYLLKGREVNVEPVEGTRAGDTVSY